MRSEIEQLSRGDYWRRARHQEKKVGVEAPNDNDVFEVGRVQFSVQLNLLLRFVETQQYRYHTPCSIKFYNLVLAYL
jgi:hypothetical protein